MRQNTREGGYMTLLAVLIVGSFCLATAMVLLKNTIDTSQSTSIAINSVSARNMAEACVEEGLQQIHDDVTYIGSGIINPTDGSSCTYTVTSSGKYTRKIVSSASKNNVFKKVEAYVNIGASRITLSSWKEI